MIDLEFWDEEAELVIAHIAAGNPPAIPECNDHADVYESTNPGLCAYVKVTGRQFYYNPSGELSRVRLYCNRPTSAG